MELQCELLSRKMRRTLIEIAQYCNSGEGYWGAYMSSVEILSVLYGKIMNLQDHSIPYSQKDKFILSKGHSGLAMYTIMYLCGLISYNDLLSFGQPESSLTLLASMNEKLGVECSGGSLGLGLPLAVGMALLAKRKHYNYRTYTLVGDGEMNEGANWEALLCGAHYNLNNLVLIIDYNHFQSDGACDDIMNISDLHAKLQSFHWKTYSVDGHNCAELQYTLEESKKNNMPTAIIANTIKGKGISFMENNNDWHHAKLIKKDLENAKKEVGLI